MYSCFEISTRDEIAHIRFNRPQKRNSMVREFWDELPSAVRQLDAEAVARVLVLSSEGPHFTAGLDLAMFGEGAVTGKGADQAEQKKQRALRFMENLELMQDAFSALERCRVPVLAAVQGGCIGGGVDLVTACDMRYAVQNAYFTIFEIKVGMAADVGTFPRIVKLLPEGVARELAYTGRPLLADEAHRLGFVNQLYESQDAMLKGVMAVAAEIASHPPLAVHGCKRAITYARDHATQDGLDWISMWNASMLLPDEVQESLAARKEKRRGRFARLPKRESKVG